MSTTPENTAIELPKNLHEKAKKAKIAIVTAEWNVEITEAMENACYNTLKKYLPEENIHIQKVPGSFELPLGAQFFAESGRANAVICLGCLIKGETPHFDYISESVSLKIADLNLKYNLPFVFGVLTTLNEEQAKERSGGKLGNKGEEAAVAALRMLSIKYELSNSSNKMGFN